MLKLKTMSAMLILATTLFASTALAAPVKQCFTIQGGKVVASTAITCVTSAASKTTAACTNNAKCLVYTSACTQQSKSCSTNTTSSNTVKTPSATTPPSSGTTTTATSASTLESAMLKLINDERAKNGLSPLAMDNTLVSLARTKSTDMIKNNYFAHNSPTYGSASDMVKNAGMKVSAVGENIAHHGSMEKAHVALMASAGHRANILGKSYNAVGIGIVADKNGYPMITQIFVRK